MTKRTVEDTEIVVFLRALAWTMWNTDNLKPEECNTENLMLSFDYYLKKTTKQVERDGGFKVREDVEALHDTLKDALEKVKLLKAPTGSPV